MFRFAVFAVLLATLAMAAPPARNSPIFQVQLQPNPKNSENRTHPIVDYGRNLSQNIAEALLPQILQINRQLYDSAADIEKMLPPEQAVLGRIVAVPLQFGALLSDALAPAVVKSIVSRPLDAVTTRVVELLGSISPNTAASRSPLFTLPVTSSSRKVSPISRANMQTPEARDMASMAQMMASVIMRLLNIAP